MPDGIRIYRENRPEERVIARLCDALVDCVEGGASVSFMAPISRETGRAFTLPVSGPAAGRG
jgi:hypothetical protein